MSDSPNPIELLDRACLLAQMGRYEQAEMLLKQYLSIDPKCAEAYALLSLVYGYTQRIELSSIEAARQAVALDPNNSYNYFILTIAYQRRHLPDRAEKSIAIAIKLNPQVAYYFAHQAEVYSDQNRWQEAIESTKRGLELDPEEVSCLKIQFTALLKLRLFSEATKTVHLLLSLYPNDADVHRLIGNLYLKKNEIQRAIIAYQESLRLNPLQPSIQELVRYQTARLKRLQTAKPKQYSTTKKTQHIKNKIYDAGSHQRLKSNKDNDCLSWLHRSVFNVLQKLIR
ncbi:tetratricopeptide repeat protein [Chamaesiphon minutus]|uniref:Tetratricopeptide repeat protein n=1 Tax=Chamaesiphon minutus (strain ATCC 27169 / PCC 6605) TaxID=1173020 RepID=K9UJI4_CHAP6|nr:tetratricopeptide repeat protein [Chamaesiphon minutus]AFY94798.1 tetratricopeptide repeat protein [Chamaesiphon minutus PCC 6605]